MLLRNSASVCTPANREGSAKTMNHFLDEVALIPAKDDLFDEAGNIGAGSKKFPQDWMDCYLA